MPPDRYPSQDAFDIEMLNPQTLYGSDGLAAALRKIEPVCYRGDPEATGMIEALSSRPYLLEYIISGVLNASVRLCTSPTLIILSSSVGGGRICDVIKVDNRKLSHVRRAKHEHHEHADPSTIFIFATVRRASFHF